MRITQMPTTVTLKKKEGWKPYPTPGQNPPFDVKDIPTDVPVQVFGWMEYITSSGTVYPCWLLLGHTGVYPVHMSLVGMPMTWDEEVIE